MKKSSLPTFMYPYWTKTLGLVLIFVAIIFFVFRITQYEIIDIAGASFPVAMGLIMIFFSKEKAFDERIAHLKFKSLAVAVPVAAVVAMLINYFQNYNGYTVGTNSWYSISAFEYLSITLTIAIGYFQYLKLKE